MLLGANVTRKNAEGLRIICGQDVEGYESISLALFLPKGKGGQILAPLLSLILLKIFPTTYIKVGE